MLDPSAKPGCSFHQESSGHLPAEKTHTVIPGLVFVEGQRNRLWPVPHSGIFSDGQGVSTMRQPSYLPNTVTADIFLFQRGENEASRPLAVRRWPHDVVGGGCPETEAKMSLPPHFSGRWTAANSMSKSAPRRPQNVLK
jgi:hypothetical protein